MGNVVGIDLGTTNSVAAFKWSEVATVVTADDNPSPDRKLTRSAVASQEDKFIVGERAYGQGHSANVITSIKRLMGRGFGDEVVQKQLSRFGYKISQSTQGTENSLSVWLTEKEYSPEQISAEILKKVIDNAQTYQKEKGQTRTITNAVITIPAYFNDKQRYATQTAARLAGLVSVELLPEPTAAAISYGFKPDSDEVKNILVYDFGGGTFDSSLITAAGNSFIESGKAGDLWLGGDDIDNLIIDYVKQQVAEEEGFEDIDALIDQMPHDQRVRFLGDLKLVAEQAKIELSSATSTTIIPATPLLDHLGMTVPIDVTLTRQTFEEMIAPLVERSLAICQDAIKYSEGYDLDLIDVILLVGGSSQIPLVQRKAKEAFGDDKVVVHPRPMYAVAEGAAIVSAGLTEKVTTVSRDYFIELVDNPRYPIIKQGDILPVATSHTFRTEADGQRLIHFKFFSPDQVSESLDLVKRDERIGDMWLALDSTYPKGTEVLVTTELDETNSSLQITAALKNDPSIKVSCSFSRGGEDEKISQTVEQTIKQLNEEGNLTELGVQEAYQIAGDVVRASNQIQKDGKVQSDRLQVAKSKLKELETFACEEYELARDWIRDFTFVTEDLAFLLLEGQKERLERLTKQLEEAIASSNLSAVQKLLEDAKQEVKNLPELVQLMIACRVAIVRANTLNPTKARVMAGKLSQMLYALESGNTS
ncbi:MAG: Hsp70 family protein, partial [Chroococcales cyanobacterium]